MLTRVCFGDVWTDDEALTPHPNPCGFSFHLTLIKALIQQLDLKTNHHDICVHIYLLHLVFITNQALRRALRSLHAVFNKLLKASQSHMRDGPLVFITHRTL